MTLRQAGGPGALEGGSDGDRGKGLSEGVHIPRERWSLERGWLLVVSVWLGPQVSVGTKRPVSGTKENLKGSRSACQSLHAQREITWLPLSPAEGAALPLGPLPLLPALVLRR